MTHSDEVLPPAYQAHNTLGLVMAAGFSRRFGPDDKRLARLSDGSPLLGHTLRQLLPAFSHPSSGCQLAVVIRPGDDRSALGIPAECATLTAPHAEQGLGASIADAVRAIRNTPRWQAIDSIAVLLGDMPALQPETVCALISQSSRESIIRPRYTGQLGHPVIFGRRFWADLSALSAEQGARAVITANRQALRVVEVDDHGVLQDIDTREQLFARD